MQLQNLVGFVLPPVIDFINKKIGDDSIRFMVSAAICIIVGLLLNIDKLGDMNSLLGNIAVVFATAQTTYNLYWKKSTLRKVIK